jgi:hypothetical protein
LPADVDAVHVRHHAVEDDEPRAFALEQPHCFGAVGRHQDAVAPLPEKRLKAQP